MTEVAPPSYIQSTAPSEQSCPQHARTSQHEQATKELKFAADFKNFKIEEKEKEAQSKDDVYDDAQLQAEFIKGCPALLLPINDNWAPTARDLEAPCVLPARKFAGRARVMWERSAGKPLDPLPASFERPAPARSVNAVPGSEPNAPTYSSFDPFYVPGKKKQIAQGFEPRYPAHIMVDHNVSAIDWDRFLVNLRVVGALRGYETWISILAPMPLILVHAGYGNYWITKGIMAAFAKRHHPEVLALVEIYQHRFFQPRGLDVFIARGNKRVTGHFPGDQTYLRAPNVELGLPLKKGRKLKNIDSSSESDSDSSEDEATSKQERKIAKKKAKIARKEAKIEKKVKVMEMASRRREAIREEEAEGFKIPKRPGKYRLIVQPQVGPAPQPPAAWLQRMETTEKKWGKQKDTSVVKEEVAIDELKSIS
jgi:hypothetical protein